MKRKIKMMKLRYLFFKSRKVCTKSRSKKEEKTFSVEECFSISADGLKIIKIIQQVLITENYSRRNIVSAIRKIEPD